MKHRGTVVHGQYNEACNNVSIYWQSLLFRLCSIGGRKRRPVTTRVICDDAEWLTVTCDEDNHDGRWRISRRFRRQTREITDRPDARLDGERPASTVSGSGRRRCWQSPEAATDRPRVVTICDRSVFVGSARANDNRRPALQRSCDRLLGCYVL